MTGWLFSVQCSVKHCVKPYRLQAIIYTAPGANTGWLTTVVVCTELTMIVRSDEAIFLLFSVVLYECSVVSVVLFASAQ